MATIRDYADAPVVPKSSGGIRDGGMRQVSPRHGIIGIVKQATTTCDICGTTKDEPVMPGSIGGHGWFTISRAGYAIAAEPVPAGSFDQPRPPDLCSWECVAAFASKRAGT